MREAAQQEARRCTYCGGLVKGPWMVKLDEADREEWFAIEKKCQSAQNHSMLWFSFAAFLPIIPLLGILVLWTTDLSVATKVIMTLVGCLCMCGILVLGTSKMIRTIRSYPVYKTQRDFLKRYGVPEGSSYRVLVADDGRSR